MREGGLKGARREERLAPPRCHRPVLWGCRKGVSPWECRVVGFFNTLLDLASAASAKVVQVMLQGVPRFVRGATGFAPGVHLIFQGGLNVQSPGS